MTDKQLAFCLGLLTDKLENAIQEALKGKTGSLEPIETIINDLRLEIESLKESDGSENE